MALKLKADSVGEFAAPYVGVDQRQHHRWVPSRGTVSCFLAFSFLLIGPSLPTIFTVPLCLRLGNNRITFTQMMG